MDRLAVVIPARLDSTRFPAKLLQPVAGRTVLEWTWSRARAARGVDGVWIATDSDEIARAAAAFGAAVVRTGACASGSDRVAEALAAIRPAPRFVIDLQGDEPLIDPAAITRVAETLRASGEAIVTCGAPLSTFEDWVDPDVVKVVCAPDGRALLFSRLPIPGTRGRPDPAAFARVRSLVMQHVGLYGFPSGLLRRFLALSRSRLEEIEGLEQWRAMEAGIAVRVVAIEWAAPSIDTPADLERARAALEAEARREGRDP
jgi:3-deoxy-manno-octulosonate cytidylyltransferase (CMP-KDO synthetase)